MSTSGQNQQTSNQQMPRVRVLFLHPNDELYGSDRVLLNLLNGLDHSRFEPHVALGDDLGRDGPVTRELQAHQIPVYQMPLACIRRTYLSPTGVPWFARRLYHSIPLVTDLIKREHIDLVYSNTLAVWTGAFAAARTRRPHIWHSHEIVDHPAALRALLRRFVPRCSQRVVCVSRAALDHLLLTPHSKAKGTVLYNGVDPREWLTAAGRQRVRDELGCASDDTLIGMVGRISDFKAPDLFVEAASLLQARHTGLHFCIAGAPVPGQSHVLERVERLIAASPAPERIHLLGFRHDVPDLMAAMDIFVVPSRAPEPFPLVNLQAMFAGKPIVAADTGAMREAIDDGATGLVVPNVSPHAIADALSMLVRHPERRAAMGDAGRRRALADFTLERQVRAFNGLLWQEYLAVAGSVPLAGAQV